MLHPIGTIEAASAKRDERPRRLSRDEKVRVLVQLRARLSAIKPKESSALKVALERRIADLVAELGLE